MFNFKKIFSICTLVCAFSTVAYASPQDAVTQSKYNAQHILQILAKDNGKNQQQLRQEVENFAIPYFDFERMTALAVGLPWRQATAEQKTELMNAFKGMLIRIYAGTMMQYKDIKIEVSDTPVVHKDGKVVIVRTKVFPNNNSKGIGIDYTFYHESDGQYRVYDVAVMGDSLVSTYRNQFNDIISKSGIDGLIQALQKKQFKSKVKLNN